MFSLLEVHKCMKKEKHAYNCHFQSLSPLFYLWLQVGSKYEEENEDDLKDKLDFIQPIQVAPILGTMLVCMYSVHCRHIGCPLLHVRLLLYCACIFEVEQDS